MERVWRAAHVVLDASMLVYGGLILLALLFGAFQADTTDSRVVWFGVAGLVAIPFGIATRRVWREWTSR